MTADPSFNHALPKSFEIAAEVRSLPGFDPRNRALSLTKELEVVREEIERRLASGETYDLLLAQIHARRTVINPLHAIETVASLPLTDTTALEVIIPESRQPLQLSTRMIFEHGELVEFDPGTDA